MYQKKVTHITQWLASEITHKKILNPSKTMTTIDTTNCSMTYTSNIGQSKCLDHMSYKNYSAEIERTRIWNTT